MGGLVREIIFSLLQIGVSTQCSDEDFGQCVGSSRSDERLTRMEGHVENGLVEFLPVGRYLLDTCLVL